MATKRSTHWEPKLAEIMRLRGTLPLRGRIGAEFLHCGSGEDMALKVEGIVDGGMHAQEALGGSRRLTR